MNANAEALATLIRCNDAVAAHGMVVYANSMIHAQVVTLSNEEKDLFQAQADAVRAVTGETGPVAVYVNVYDSYLRTAKIGELKFEF